MAALLKLRWGAAYQQIWRPFRHKCFKGGRGSQKSHVIAEYCVIKSTQKREIIVGARQFQKSIRLSSKALIEQKILDLGLGSQFDVTTFEIKHKYTKSTFNFIGLDRNPDSARSLEGCSICWVEEARKINNRSMNTLIPTVRAKGSELLWSWNPVDARDPVEKEFVFGERENILLKHTTYKDNPFFWETSLPEEMLLAKKKDEKKYKHVWLGDYEDGGQAVIFPNVRSGEMDIPETIAPQYGMDYGSNNDPNCLVRFYVFESIKTIYITHEKYLGSSTERWMEYIMDVPGIKEYSIVADGAWPQTISTMNSNGFSVFAAAKGPGSVLQGIRWLEGYDIVAHPRCTRFIEEAKLYKWQVDPYTEKPLNIPEDKDNHGWDALRYGTERNRTIQPVTVGTLKFPRKR